MSAHQRILAGSFGFSQPQLLNVSFRSTERQTPSPVGGAVAHGAGLAVATGHDWPDRITRLPMDLQLQVTPQIGHPCLAQGAGHRHRAAVGPGQQQHLSLVVGTRQVTSKPGGMQRPHRLKQLIPEQWIAGDGKQLVLLGKGGDGDRVEQVALEHPLELDRLAGDTGQVAGGRKMMAAAAVDEADPAIPAVEEKIVAAPRLHDPDLAMGQVAGDGGGARVIEVATATGLGKGIQIGKVLEGGLGGGEHLHLTNVTGPVLKLGLFTEAGQGIDLDSVALVLAVDLPPAAQLAWLGVPACRSPLVPASDAGGTDRGGDLEVIAQGGIGGQQGMEAGGVAQLMLDKAHGGGQHGKDSIKCQK